MTVSEVIERFLIDLLSKNENAIEIQRNELASQFNCVPSQINYVIRTRFTAEQGYSVESRRGGGGYVKIRRVKAGTGDYLMRMVSSIGETLSQTDAFAYVKNLFDNGQLSSREAALMLAAVSDRALALADGGRRDQVRAQMVKNMLVSLVKEES